MIYVYATVAVVLAAALAGCSSGKASEDAAARQTQVAQLRALERPALRTIKRSFALVRARRGRA
jgi:hypothetical protein